MIDGRKWMDMEWLQMNGWMEGWMDIDGYRKIQMDIDGWAYLDGYRQIDRSIDRRIDRQRGRYRRSIDRQIDDSLTQGRPHPNTALAYDLGTTREAAPKHGMAGCREKQEACITNITALQAR